MSAEYLRILRTCFLELHRHEVFSTDRNLAYEEYLDSTAFVAKITVPIMIAGWTAVFFAHRRLLATPLRQYRTLRPLLTVGVGVGLSALMHVWLYRGYLLEPLNRVALMYEQQAREMCPELKAFPLVSLQGEATQENNLQ